jgi:3-methyladenine DNA glycosylase Tag
VFASKRILKAFIISLRTTAVPTWSTNPPKDDASYFDLMSRAIFTAGLNWRVVEKKWPDFRKAFDGFSPAKVSRLSDRDVKALMNNTQIIRNEKKIRATIENARAVVDLEKEHGSFKKYMDSFGNKEKLLLEDLPRRFKFMGPSTARMFLYMAGYPLTPTKEEKAWMEAHPEHH